MRTLNCKQLGKTDIYVPPIIFGTSCFGNLYQALPDPIKHEIIKEMFVHVEKNVTLDSAGKYGAGLALEVIGENLKKLDIKDDQVFISNKLGWYRVPLKTPEPTFEYGVWKDLKYDAVQKISYDGILECYEQGCELLGGGYKPQIVSVHDPDEYLAQAKNETGKKKLFQDVIDAYKALIDLKRTGHESAVGVGSKDWKVIRDISQKIDLDWVMLAVSFTIFSHPAELLTFMDDLTSRGIGIINSAVFNAGFLTGGNYFNYRLLSKDMEEDKPCFIWRDKFFKLCQQYNVLPADACVQFGMSHPGIISVALNTSKPDRVKQNVASVEAEIPIEFWSTLKAENLIAKDYPYLG